MQYRGESVPIPTSQDQMCTTAISVGVEDMMNKSGVRICGYNGYLNPAPPD